MSDSGPVLQQVNAPCDVTTIVEAGSKVEKERGRTTTAAADAACAAGCIDPLALASFCGVMGLGDGRRAAEIIRPAGREADGRMAGKDGSRIESTMSIPRFVSLILILISCVACSSVSTPTPSIPVVSPPATAAITRPSSDTPTLFSTIGPTKQVPTPTPDPTALPPSYVYACSEVPDISLVSSDMGWAVVNCKLSTGPRMLNTGLIYRLADGRWERAVDAPVLGPPYSCYTAVSAISENEMWAAGLEGGVYTCNWGDWLLHYVDGEWEQVRLEEELAEASDGLFFRHWEGVLDLDFVDAEHGWAVGYGLIYRYASGQWSVDLDLPSDVNCEHCSDGGGENRFLSVSMADIDNGWAGGEGLLYRYHQGTWMSWEGSSFASATVKDIHTTGPDEAWAVGYRENFACCKRQGEQRYYTEFFTPLVWHYTEGQWEEMIPSVEDHQVVSTKLTSITMVEANDGWAIGWNHNGAVVLHYTGGLGRWEAVSPPPDKYSYTIAATDSSHVWIGGWAGLFQYLPPDEWGQAELGSIETSR